MEIKDRDAQERKIAEALATLSAAHREQLIRYLGTPPDINRVPDEFWRECEVETKKQLAALLLLLFLRSGQGLVAQIGAEQIPCTLRTIEQTGQQWAEQEAERTAKQVTATTVERVRGAAGAYYNELDPQAFRDRIDGIYGEGRAAGIARDKTTNAQTAGQEAVRQSAAAEGVTMVAFWNSSKDSDVCPLCRPLHGKPESVWSREAPNGPGEEFHHGCRCFLDYKPGTDAQATPWVPESLLPDLYKPLSQLLQEGWVTLKPNGDDEEGYARVFIEDGKITKGPAGLAAKGINSVDDFGKGKGSKGSKGAATKEPKPEPKAKPEKKAESKPEASPTPQDAIEKAASDHQWSEATNGKSHPDTIAAKAKLDKLSGKKEAALAPAPAPAPEKPAAPLAKAATPDSFQADFESAFRDADTKGRNFATLHDVRQKLPQFSREEFDAGLAKMRAEGKLTLDGYDGTSRKLSKEELDSGVPDGDKRLPYVSYRQRLEDKPAGAAATAKTASARAEDWHAAEQKGLGLGGKKLSTDELDDLSDEIKHAEQIVQVHERKGPTDPKYIAAKERLDKLNAEVSAADLDASFERHPDGALKTLPVLEDSDPRMRNKFRKIAEHQGNGAASERETIQNYQSTDGYQSMNDTLRTNGLPKSAAPGSPEEGALKLQAAIEQHGKLPAPITVTRGIHGTAAQDFVANARQAIANGSEMELQGFTSTSTSGSVAIEQFAGPGKMHPTILVMRAKNGLLIHKGIGADMGEDELLQAHGVRYRPIRVSDGVTLQGKPNRKVTVIEMEQV